MVLSKRSIIVALTGLNLLLLAALILSSYTPPAAYAQGRGRAGDYLMATVQIHEDLDALTVINIPRGFLYVFRPQQTRNGAKLALTGQRNLNTDFRRGN